MSQPRVRGSGAGGRAGATAKDAREQSPTMPAEGPAKRAAEARPRSSSPMHWAGDIRAFVDWCEGATDLEAYRAALATVPPRDTWKAVSRTLHAEIEFTTRPADTGPQAKTVAEVYNDFMDMKQAETAESTYAWCLVARTAPRMTRAKCGD